MAIQDVECSQGSTLFYCAAGDGAGPPLLFLHGWGADHRYFHYQLEAFGRYRLVIPDLEGFGSSSSETVPKRFSIGDQAEKVYRLCRTLDIASVVVVGHSMGGMIAQELALSHPEFVAGLILEDSSPGIIHVPSSNILSTFGFLIYAVPRTVRSLFARTVAVSSKHSSDAVKGLMEEYARVTCCRVLVRYVSAMRSWSSLERLHRITVPTLLIWGEEDRLLSESHRILLEQGLKSSETVLIPRSGHIPHLEVPEAFNDEVRRFLEVVLRR